MLNGSPLDALSGYSSDALLDILIQWSKTHGLCALRDWGMKPHVFPSGVRGIQALAPNAVGLKPTPSCGRDVTMGCVPGRRLANVGGGGKKQKKSKKEKKAGSSHESRPTALHPIESLASNKGGSTSLSGGSEGSHESDFFASVDCETGPDGDMRLPTGSTSLILQVPSHLMFTAHHALATNPCLAALARVCAALGRPLREKAVLCLAVIENTRLLQHCPPAALHMRLTSPAVVNWFPYVCALPPTYDTPLFWSQEQRALLRVPARVSAVDYGCLGLESARTEEEWRELTVTLAAAVVVLRFFSVKGSIDTKNARTARTCVPEDLGMKAGADASAREWGGAAEVIVRRLGPLVCGAASQLALIRPHVTGYPHGVARSIHGTEPRVGEDCVDEDSDNAILECVAVSMAEYRWASAVLGTRTVHTPPLATGATITEARAASFFAIPAPRSTLTATSSSAEDVPAGGAAETSTVAHNISHNLEHLLASYPGLHGSVGHHTDVLCASGTSNSDAASGCGSRGSSSAVGNGARTHDVRPLLHACFGAGVDVLVAADKPYQEDAEAVRVTLAEHTTLQQRTTRTTSTPEDAAIAVDVHEPLPLSEGEVVDSAEFDQASLARDVTVALHWAATHAEEGTQRPVLAAPTCALVPFFDLLNHSDTALCSVQWQGAMHAHGPNTNPSVVTAADAAVAAATVAGAAVVAPVEEMTSHAELTERNGVPSRELNINPYPVSTPQHPAYLLSLDSGSYFPRPGQEIFISYGLLSNLDLFSRYGFVIDQNKHDLLGVDVAFVEHVLRDLLFAPTTVSTAPLRHAAVARSGGNIARAIVRPPPRGAAQPRGATVAPRAVSSSPSPPTPASESLALPPAWSFAQLPATHVELLKLCGLYSLPPHHRFKLSRQGLPWDLTLFVMVRVLSHKFINAWAAEQGIIPSSTSACIPAPRGAPTHTHAGKSVAPSVADITPPSVTLQAVADVLLQDRCLSATHHRAVQLCLRRVVVAAAEACGAGEHVLCTRQSDTVHTQPHASVMATDDKLAAFVEEDLHGSAVYASMPPYWQYVTRVFRKGRLIVLRNAYAETCEAYTGE